MDNIKIQTTQNVDIEYQLASIGDRILATLLDYVFFLAYGVMWLIIFAFTNKWLEKHIAIVVIAFLPILFYDLFCETFLKENHLVK